MKSRILSILVGITSVVALCCTTSHAAVPQTINYQGYLTSPSGAAVNASVPMVFKLYDAVTGGNVLHTETQPTVVVSNGIFNVVLGTTTALTASFAGPYWLGVTVGADPEMTPRQPLTSSPYALRAVVSDYLTAGAMALGDVNLTGSLLKGGVLFLHTLGFGNTAVGISALPITSTGDFNNAVGNGALARNSSGRVNNALGGDALANNKTGCCNAAVGDQALWSNVGGSYNVAVGDQALFNNVGGQFNIGIGADGGASLTTGNNNIAIGNAGVAGESGTIRIGNSAVHTKTILAGNVGIGTANPLVPLHVTPGTAKTNTANTRAFAVLTNEPLGAVFDPNNPFGLDVRLIGGATLADRSVYIQSTDFNTASGGNILLQADGGNVGIGTTTPTRAKVEIIGFQNATLPGTNAFYGTIGTGGLFTPQVLAYSLYASGAVAAVGFVAFSDQRIKRSMGRSNAARDLATLAALEITDYTYIDSANHGNKPHKKVIAQQVEKIYPQAVSQMTDVVPDIYLKADIKDGWIKLATNLKKGERVRLIGKAANGVFEVLDVAANRFRTDFKADADTVFVYGREVKDFRSVDYEAIAMLNVSATQEINRNVAQLNRSVEAQAAEIAQLKTQLAMLAQLQAQVAEIAKANTTQIAYRPTMN